MKTKYISTAIIFCTSALSLMAQEVADTVADTYGELEELVITAKKDIVKTDGATLTYDMEQDDSSKGQNLLEALRKIPMVTVDGQDNIYIKGSNNFKVYVNGKEDPMLTANYKQVFKAMPAESVSKVEVITEPGAKYDAEGTGGILNLILERKQSKDGYTGSVNLSLTNQQSVASLYGRAKYDKVTADASVNYVNNSWQKQHSGSKSSLHNDASDTDYLQKTENDQEFMFNYLGANINMSWEPSANDLFTFGADINMLHARITNFSVMNSMFDRSGTMRWETCQNIRGYLGNLGASGNASYRHLLDDKGQSITAAYRFSYGKNPMNLDYENRVTEGDIALSPFEKNIREEYQREHTATLDYVMPFAEDKHKLEAGAKGIFRRNNSDTYHTSGDTPTELLPVPDDNGNTRQIQDIYAAYASYTGHFDKVTVTAGARYEHTYMGLDLATGIHENFRRHLNDVTPNAAVSYTFGPATNLRLSYQMRINRPGISQMNPTEFQITQTIVQVGNKNLESEKYHSMTLMFSNWKEKIGYNVALSYGQADNSIETYNYYENGIEYDTYANIGRFRRTELSAYINWNISSQMSLSLNGGINYVDLNARSRGMHNSGWKGNYGINWNYRGPWSMKYSVYGGQSTGNINLQGDNKGWYYYGLSISKSFLKDDALSVTVNASNFFTKNNRYKSSRRYDSYTDNSVWYNRSWQVGLSVGWNFGKLQDKVKETDSRLENNDTKNSSGGAKGGIGL